MSRLKFLTLQCSQRMPWSGLRGCWCTVRALAGEKGERSCPVQAKILDECNEWTLNSSSGSVHCQIHTGRGHAIFVRKSFNVACVQCGHFHSQQVGSCVNWALVPSFSGVQHPGTLMSRHAAGLFTAEASSPNWSTASFLYILKPIHGKGNESNCSLLNLTICWL